MNEIYVLIGSVAANVSCAQLNNPLICYNQPERLPVIQSKFVMLCPGTFAVVSLMVGGAVESQMDTCLEAIGAAPRTVDSGLSNTTTPYANFSTSTATMQNVTAFNETTAGPGVTDSNIDPELQCKIAIATTLTILVGFCQVRR